MLKWALTIFILNAAMPVTRSAKKKQRADRKREKANNFLRDLLKKSLRQAQKKPTLESVSNATKVIDKLSKKHIIHKNKAARLKSSLSKLLPKKKAF